MARSLDDLSPRAALVEISTDFHRRGWMAGTAGNLSARTSAAPDNCLITASSLPKGRLTENDFLRIHIPDGAVIESYTPQAKPSAETAIHRVIYQNFPQAMACLHVHTVDASIVAAQLPPHAREIPLPPLEMIKGLDIWEEQPEVSLPLFENLLDVSAIARAIHEQFRACPPRLPALMIRAHGMTVWGRSLQEAYNRMEIVEFLMSYLARKP